MIQAAGIFAGLSVHKTLPGIHFTHRVNILWWQRRGKIPQKRKRKKKMAFSAVKILTVTWNTKINLYKIKSPQMRLPHWPKLSNNSKKTCLCCLSFFFPRSLKNNINTSEWTQMEQEEGTRKGQYNLATGWDISWEERANKQELATHLRTHAGKQAHSLEARVWLLVHKELRCNNFGWCTHGAEGLPGTSQVQKWCPHPSRGKRWKSELLFQARQELVCVIKCALATYVKTSCFVFLVICLSSYPNQGQQPKLKPFSCLRAWIVCYCKNREPSSSLTSYQRSTPASALHKAP